MPVITQINTHAADAKARLLNQFKGKTLIDGMLDAFNVQTQDFEDAVIPLNLILEIATMIGAQLDGIGTIVSEARQGASDADYRTALTGRIVALYSSGTGEDIIAAHVLATGSTQVDVFPNYPAGYDVYGDGSQPSDLLTTLEAASVAGVKIGLLDLLEWNDSDGALWNDSDTIYVTYASSG